MKHRNSVIKYYLPETGYVRLPQIIGQKEVTEEEAAANRKRGKGPRTPRPAIPAIYPCSKSKLWNDVKTGRFVSPIKLSERITAWRVEDIRAMLDQGVVREEG